MPCLQAKSNASQKDLKLLVAPTRRPTCFAQRSPLNNEKSLLIGKFQKGNFTSLWDALDIIIVKYLNWMDRFLKRPFCQSKIEMIRKNRTKVQIQWSVSNFLFLMIHHLLIIPLRVWYSSLIGWTPSLLNGWRHTLHFENPTREYSIWDIRFLENWF